MFVRDGIKELSNSCCHHILSFYLIFFSLRFFFFLYTSNRNYCSWFPPSHYKYTVYTAKLYMVSVWSEGPAYLPDLIGLGLMILLTGQSWSLRPGLITGLGLHTGTVKWSGLGPVPYLQTKRWSWFHVKTGPNQTIRSLNRCRWAKARIDICGKS